MTDKTPCYRIVDWEKHFEISQSKRAGKITWVAVPNKHDGKTFRRIARHPKAPDLYAAWQLLVQVASKMPTRGVLRDEDGPTRSVDLADMTGFPQAIFDLAFEVLSTREFRWLEIIDHDENTTPLGADSEHGLPRYPTGQTERTGQDDTAIGFHGYPTPASQPAIYAAINTPEINEAWNQYVPVRATMKGKRFPIISAEIMLFELNKMGPDKALRAIRASIKSEWPDVYDPDAKKGGNGSRTTDEPSTAELLRQSEDNLRKATS